MHRCPFGRKISLFLAGGVVGFGDALFHTRTGTRSTAAIQIGIDCKRAIQRGKFHAFKTISSGKLVTLVGAFCCKIRHDRISTAPNTVSNLAGEEMGQRHDSWPPKAEDDGAENTTEHHDAKDNT